MPNAQSRSSVFEWFFTLASLWFTYGLFLDGWAHNHLKSALETFFTPWHAVFYAGYFVTLGVLLVWMWMNKTAKGSWYDAIPAGYGAALTGSFIFFLGGIGDMIWHTVFGIEADINALLSPTHLMLATGMVMTVAGPLRAWLLRKHSAKSAWIDHLPMVLSAAFAFSVVTFMTQFTEMTDMHMALPMPETGKLIFFKQGLPILGSLWYTVALLGILFIPLRKTGRLPAGTVTIVVTVNMLLTTWMRTNMILVFPAILAALIADLWLQHIGPVHKDIRGLRIFSFLLPFLFFFLQVITVIGLKGSWWTVHMWAGLGVECGLVGLMLSYVVWTGNGKK